jgi:serine/threonine protein kinase
MICPQCKKSFDDSFKFCPECGSSVSGVSGISNVEASGDVSLGGIGTVVGKEVQDSGERVQGSEFEDHGSEDSIGGMQTVIGKGGQGSGLEYYGSDLSTRYEILEEIGRGGFAKVWRARDLKLDRLVAVKRLVEPAVKDHNWKMTLERFRREARAIAGLNHRNIVGVYDVGADSEGDYIVMELVEGGTLRDLIKSKGKLTSEEAVLMARGIAQGLGHAHKKNLVHRDIKPANVLLLKEGGELTPKIVDFGLARVGTDSEISMSGYGMGTPWYMPPEQRRDAKSVNHTADIYALGKTMYEMLTGEVPDQVDVDKVPEGLGRIILKCVKNAPDERYFSVDELLNHLNAGAGRSSPPKTETVSSSSNICPSCGSSNEAGAKFCEGCGLGLSSQCPECGKSNQVSRGFCVHCGTDIPKFAQVENHLKQIEVYYSEGKFSRALKESELAAELSFSACGKRGQGLAELLNARKHVLLNAVDLHKQTEKKLLEKLEEGEKAVKRLDFTHASMCVRDVESFRYNDIFPVLPEGAAGAKGLVKAWLKGTGVVPGAEALLALKKSSEPVLNGLRRNVICAWMDQTGRSVRALMHEGRFDEAWNRVEAWKELPLDTVTAAEFEKEVRHFTHEHFLRELEARLNAAGREKDHDKIMDLAKRILAVDPAHETARRLLHAARLRMETQKGVEQALEALGNKDYIQAVTQFEAVLEKAGSDFKINDGENGFLCSELLQKAKSGKVKVEEAEEDLRAALNSRRWRVVPQRRERLHRLQPSNPLLAVAEKRYMRARRRKKFLIGSAAAVLVIVGAGYGHDVIMERRQELAARQLQKEEQQAAEERARAEQRAAIQRYEAAKNSRNWALALQYAEEIQTHHSAAGTWMTLYQEVLDAQQEFDGEKRSFFGNAGGRVDAGVRNELRTLEHQAQTYLNDGNLDAARRQFRENFDFVRQYRQQSAEQAQYALERARSEWEGLYRELSEMERAHFGREKATEWRAIQQAIREAESSASDPFLARRAYNQAHRQLTALRNEYQRNESARMRNLEELRGETLRILAQMESVDVEDLRDTAPAESAARIRELRALQRSILPLKRHNLWSGLDSGLRERISAGEKKLEAGARNLNQPWVDFSGWLGQNMNQRPTQNSVRDFRQFATVQWPVEIQEGMLAGLGLGYYTIGEAETGRQLINHLRTTYPGSRFISHVDLQQYFTDCTSCRGRGSIQTQAVCQQCHGQRTCRLCGGSGRLAGIDSRFGRVQRPCSACGGSGRCTQCPTGMISNPCRACSGSGGTLNPDTMLRGYRTVLQMLQESVRNSMTEIP